jgi:hypothetical protein
VDPASGNDANSGTTQSGAWKTIPGTKTRNASGWLRHAWGSIGSSSKIKAGDTIFIRAGTTMSSSLGGHLVIDSTFYDNGTSNNPISIQVSPTWGSGSFTYDGAGMTVPTWYTLVMLQSRDYITFGGASANRSFVIKNISGSGVWGLISQGRSSQHQKGIRLAFLEVTGSSFAGLGMAWTDDWVVSDSLAYNNANMGFSAGNMDDQTAVNGLFVDSKAYRNGASGSSSDLRHGFGVYGSRNISFLRCSAYENGRDGFDFGTTSNAASSSVVVIDSSAYDNGEDGYGTNGAYDRAGVTNSSTFVNSVAFNNGQAGWHIYGGATAELYHVIAHHNGSQQNFGGNYMIYSEKYGSDVYTTRVTIRNSIGYKPKAHANVYSYNSAGTQTHITSDFNIFVPRNSNSETFAETPWGNTYSYTNRPTWSGPNDRIGIEYEPSFTKIDTSSFGNNDYHITSPDDATIDSAAALGGISYSEKDRDGNDRKLLPDIGMYEFGAVQRNLAPPQNVRFASNS